MSRTIHMHMSIKGPLRNWSKSDWKQNAKGFTKADGTHPTGDELREFFIESLAEGKLCLPLGEPCEGFSYQTGCPGHEVKEAKP